MILHGIGSFKNYTKASLQLIASPNLECAVIVLENESRLLWQNGTCPGNVTIHVFQVPETIGTPVECKYEFIAGIERLCIKGESGVFEFDTEKQMPDTILREITSIHTNNTNALKETIRLLRSLCIRQNRDEEWADEPKQIRMANNRLQIINTGTYLEVESEIYKYQISIGRYKKPHKRGISITPIPLKKRGLIPVLNTFHYLDLTWELFCTIMESIGVIENGTELMEG